MMCKHVPTKNKAHGQDRRVFPLAECQANLEQEIRGSVRTARSTSFREEAFDATEVRPWEGGGADLPVTCNTYSRLKWFWYGKIWILRVSMGIPIKESSKWGAIHPGQRSWTFLDIWEFHVSTGSHESKSREQASKPLQIDSTIYSTG